MMRNLAIRAQEGEQMDSPDLPEPVYREVLGGLRRINAATLANRPTLDFLSRAARRDRPFRLLRSEEHTSELQSLMRTSYAVFCLKKKINKLTTKRHNNI